MKRREFLAVAGSVGVTSTTIPSWVRAAAIPCPPPALALDNNASATTSCTSISAGLAYLSTLSAYQVRQLTGLYAPLSGKATIAAATPSEWVNSDPGLSGLRSVTGKWSGGIGDPLAAKIYMLGGGHNDSANNGLYVYDFAGGTAPAGCSVASQSAVNAVTTGGSYSDGRIPARHTYDGMATIDGKIYVFGGVPWNPGGGFSSACWKFEGGNWSILPGLPDSGERSATVVDPVTKKILHWVVGHGMASFFNTNTNIWGNSRSVNSGTTDYASFCLDTTRNRVLSIGAGINRLWNINWVSETISQSTFPQSSILSTPAITPIYDASRDRIWILGGAGGSSGYSNLFELNPSTFVVTAHSLSGDSIPNPNTEGDSSGLGSYKRGVLLNNQAIGFISNTSSPAVVIGLP